MELYSMYESEIVAFKNQPETLLTQENIISAFQDQKIEEYFSDKLSQLYPKHVIIDINKTKNQISSKRAILLNFIEKLKEQS